MTDVVAAHQTPGATAAARLVEALAIPSQAILDQRVPKKLFLEHGAPTAADRRLLQEGIGEARWLATLKPSTVGTPGYRDDVRDYSEIAVLAVSGALVKRAARLAELIHRAIPYPVVLVSEGASDATLSLAHKRHSQGESGAWVVDEIFTATPAVNPAPDSADHAYLASLAFDRQPAAHLLATYQGWIDCGTALAAARVSGQFRLSSASDDGTARRAALTEHATLTREAALLRTQIVKEKQLARRVELNLAIRRLDARLAELLDTL